MLSSQHDLSTSSAKSEFFDAQRPLQSLNACEHRHQRRFLERTFWRSVHVSGFLLSISKRTLSFNNAVAGKANHFGPITNFQHKHKIAMLSSAKADWKPLRAPPDNSPLLSWLAFCVLLVTCHCPDGERPRLTLALDCFVLGLIMMV